MITHTFHEGERAVQERVGVAGRMAQVGPRVIRDFMPEQHCEFFAQLPFVLAGTVDADGQPWASVLAAPPGFIQSPDPLTLLVHAQPLPGDPLQHTLIEGAAMGLLGLEPHTRRRNRMNGHVQDLNESGFAVHVDQSFGNCPKYIQARKPVFLPGSQMAKPVIHEGVQLDEAARRLITKADTFFIATAYGRQTPSGHDPDPSHGVDLSHRGGKPGFVRVDADGTLTMPDFVGNFFFNTLGNIAANPRAGLLFMDFETGDVLYLAVSAEIVWEGAELQAFEGAQRLLRFKVLAMRRVEASLPLRWGPAELSPVLAGTGAWG
jgi:predicted pyridoxine 5'-phosphate oxidase superfamily flavin-nucleotide-binding protein